MAHGILRLVAFLGLLSLCVGAVVPASAVAPILPAKASRNEAAQFTDAAYLVKDIEPNGNLDVEVAIALSGRFVFIARLSGQTDYQLWTSDGTSEGTNTISDTRLPYYFEYLQVNNVLYFEVDGVESTELWKTDGTSAGTTKIKAVAGEIYDLTNVNGRLFFTAGSDLWMSDGTEQGTQRVKDDGSPYSLTNINGTLYFMAGFRELWKSDGTAAGTQLVTRFENDPYDLEPNDREELIDANRTLFITRERDGGGFDGAQLWKSDGTEQGTVLLLNQSYGSIEILTYFNGILFFEYSGAFWRSDGTIEGTIQLIDPMESGYHSKYYENWSIINGVLFFIHNDGLWRSDGTKEGTSLVYDPGDQKFVDDSFVNMNETLFIKIASYDEEEYEDTEAANELWKSDGTAAGTVRVRTFDGGNLDFDEVIGGRLLFTANDGTHGIEPWLSDGTPEGTTLIQDIVPGAGSSNPYDFVRAGRLMFFLAETPETGREWWALPLEAILPPTQPTYLPLVLR